MGIATLLTREAFLALPDAGDYELLDGELKEREMSNIASMVQFRMGYFLVGWNSASKLGYPIGDGTGLDIFEPSKNYVPRPDGAWISQGRYGDSALEGRLHVAPELVFDVLSPGNSAIDVEAKVRSYLDAGIDTVWVIYPEARRIHVFRRGHQPDILAEGDTLTTEVLPGFALAVADLFADLP